ncbi:MmgE/PrpD family protein [Sinomonas humi]|uniref:MmgE/PrpD C-terminal domain-containing protein n=1 Tax=Sinomonas humi TaxID=1338436 RepID=A0A0B2AHZ5_9MICC|nr:MmgE/PrpD family protein [Sinomonas humi]KHL01362.1 hypothetical protein LK10_15845 [Sinomonas humi]
MDFDAVLPPEQSFKPYPHCRILHALLDGLIAIVDEHDIGPSEIEAIDAWGEGRVQLPKWMNRSIDNVVDAQFSIAHGLAAAAHRLTPGPEWQRPEVVFSPSREPTFPDRGCSARDAFLRRAHVSEGHAVAGPGVSQFMRLVSPVRA